MEDKSEFDIAAEKADTELQPMLKAWTPEQMKAIKELASWWKRNFMASGHKRLGRIIARLG
jgi:dissimilatory sulfite reductase (desulfoviridin) alpha/beta subunit